MSKRRKKRKKFCKWILNKKIKPDQIFFSDETKIDLSPFLIRSIRLSEKNQDKMKEGNAGTYELINRPQKKIEKSIRIGGAICFYGLSSLLLLEGTENELVYEKSLFIK